jgi:predicted ATP-binding protein involved in virulence
VKILSIHIKELFDIFNYDIVFPDNENALIITGPNGYGKTMILNIVFNLFNQKFSFFEKLIFKEIVINLENNISIRIWKGSGVRKSGVEFIFHEGTNRIGSFSSANINDSDQIALALSKLSENMRDHQHKVTLADFRDGSTFLSNYIYALERESLQKIGNEKIETILNSIKVHLIQEQRLFKKIPNLEQVRPNSRENLEQTVMTDTIRIYAEELRKFITSFSELSTIRAQELDSSYPTRLRSEKEKFSEVDYLARYALVKAKQEKLSKYGLYEIKQDFLTYDAEDAKALTVYLKDLESKLNIFDERLKKLDLFTTILNERRFTFKTIQISREKGFFFKTSKGTELELNQLSSGEQHEVILLYELIFNVKDDVLVLIDEPEISLHVTWQKEFLSDLLRIVEMQNIQVMIATHSPAIINGRWDLTYNLEKADA